MKNKSIVTLCLVVLVALLLNYLALFGFKIGTFDFTGGTFGEHGIKQGIDLQGGLVLRYHAVDNNKNDIRPSNDEMEQVQGIFSARLTQAGYTEAQISFNDEGQISVEIPGVENTEEAEELLGKTAKLTFRNADGEVVLDGTNAVKSAKYEYSATENGMGATHHVQIEFNPDARQAFAEATAAAAAAGNGKNYISIYMDDDLISSPRVSQKIDSNTCVITGDFTQESATTLANQIQSGSLPVDLKQETSQKIGAQLGENALSTSLIAAGIGILLIMIFMVIMYRIPGLIADISLLLYVGIIQLIIGLFHINLSLSGIAGIILSIGMAVDADCIIFERMKEELALGKTIRASVFAGFDKAFSAILDSNVTTIITCVVLYLSGIGTVTGFALTLGIGVILSMITAIIITKFLMKQLVNMGIENRSLFYNANAKKGGAEANA
ncbi:MAG: protein translocase subunit SecD [Clostridia bacterium]|nr:protein translocase subunit SecD [Clostridia bacterium]